MLKWPYNPQACPDKNCQEACLSFLLANVESRRVQVFSREKMKEKILDLFYSGGSGVCLI